MSPTRLGCYQILILCLLPAAIGCQSTGFKGLKDFNLAKRIPWQTGASRRDNPPERIVGFWTESVLHKSDGTSERGFGGRLYFYDRKDSDPVQVEGQLVVYAFDEFERDATDNHPTRRYVFPAKQFSKHYSESDLGPSYSIWLPWDAVNGEQKTISLIARFEPKQGALIVSQQSEHCLPGAQTKGDQTAGIETVGIQTTGSRVAGAHVGNNHPANGPRFASYEAGASRPTVGSEPPSRGRAPVEPAASEARRRMTTTSIALPNRVGLKVPEAVVRNARHSKRLTAPANTPPWRPENASSDENSSGAEPTVPSRRAGFQPARRLAPAGPISPLPASRTLSRPAPRARPFGR